MVVLIYFLYWCVLVCFVVAASSLIFIGGLLLYDLVALVTGAIVLCLVC